VCVCILRNVGRERGETQTKCVRVAVPSGTEQPELLSKRAERARRSAGRSACVLAPWPHTSLTGGGILPALALLIFLRSTFSSCRGKADEGGREKEKERKRADRAVVRGKV
jgi:hypothetical protein